ncbi:MAG: Uma2 family endonuclease [Leptolyngbyaceae cyanobacterium CAN_BIN12]|nr:Uma2 family endonuclease [Leptolyngbyaceae cyanobacterium CAN_BIN12]
MSQTSSEKVRWTTADLDLLAADEWKRYEIIDGELFVTRAPHFRHQSIILNICAELRDWSDETQLGEAFPTPGIIFSDADNVIPDAIWISVKRMERFIDEAGHFIGAPELIVEVLSSGTMNERRDREAKLKLYSSQGVEEYWIVNRELQQIEVYRRENAVLKRAATYNVQDTITSPTLPGFECPIHRFFRQISTTR